MNNKAQPNNEMASTENGGFTLLELMIAICLASMLMLTVYLSFSTQQKSQAREQMVLEMQQNVRAVLQLMEQEIRMAGNDPTVIWGTDGIDNDGDGDTPEEDEPDEAENDRMADGKDNDCDGKIDSEDTESDEVLGIKIARSFKFRFTMDLNNDRDYCDANEHVEYAFARKYDGDKGPQDGWADYIAGRADVDGAAPIGRASGNGGSLQPIAEQIEALGFAYAFDNDQDGQLDRSGDNVLWAYDQDGNGGLDTVLDTNDDGRISAADDADKNGRIDAGDGGVLNPEVPLDRIRAVKIWLLARTRHPVRGYTNKHIYVVGDKVVRGADVNRDGSVDGKDNTDHYKHQLLSTTVVCRNMGLGL